MAPKKELTELEAQELLAQAINNTPIPIKIGKKTYHITTLKLGTQNLIAEETCRIQKSQEGNMLDIFKQFALSIPAVIKCLCYAVLNDKDKIFKNYATREHSEEYQILYEQIEWESDKNVWLTVLARVLERIDVSFFLQAVSMLTTIKDSALRTRKEVNGHT